MASQRTLYLHSLRNPGKAPMDKTALTIWPNPATDAVTINNVAGHYSMKNMLGQVMLEGSVDAAQPRVNVGNLPKGNYIISFYKAGKPLSNHFFVKQ